MDVLNSDQIAVIPLFETLIASLSKLVAHDFSLFEIRRPKVAIAHRLALYFQEALNLTEPMVIDMGYPVDSIIADILIHDREKRRLLALQIKEGYLSEAEQLALHATGSCDLTLALSLLPNKDYILIYRADEYTIDYYHFVIEQKHCYLLKQKSIADLISDRSQLKLGIRTPRKDGRSH